MLDTPSGVYGVIQIGKPLMYRDTVDLALVGAVNNLRVWNVAMGPEELQQHINYPLPTGAEGLIVESD